MKLTVTHTFKIKEEKDGLFIDIYKFILYDPSIITLLKEFCWTKQTLHCELTECIVNEFNVLFIGNKHI